MRGDSVIAQFDSAARGDTTSKPKAKKIVATGNASSFYQLASANTAHAVPSVNYVRGRIITVTFADNAVDKVNVVDQASGVYLEPVAAKAAAPTQDGAISNTKRRDP
jgi:hypothetical protein